MPGTVAGKLQKPFFGIPVGTPVGVALGDFQCSVLSSTSQLSDAGKIQTFPFKRSTAVYITSFNSFFSLFLFSTYCYILYLICPMLKFQCLSSRTKFPLQSITFHALQTLIYYTKEMCLKYFPTS